MSQAGYVALVGRPNVGKSTLLNQLLEQKISITSPKPQTTRHRIVGIKTLQDAQIVYTDTPGLHHHGKKALNRYMNRVAADSLDFADVLVWVLEGTRWNEADEVVSQHLNDVAKPVIAAVNKVDHIQDKARLLPYFSTLSSQRAFADIVPVSALRGTNIDALEACIIKHLPRADFYFSEDQITTASQRFLAAEIIREKLFRRLNQELPYALSVEIQQCKELSGVLHMDAVIWVERSGQKGIIIGEKGGLLKEIGRLARVDMEHLFQCKVYLRTWVKVRQGWSDNEQALQQLGYTLY